MLSLDRLAASPVYSAYRAFFAIRVFLLSLGSVFLRWGFGRYRYHHQCFFICGLFTGGYAEFGYGLVVGRYDYKGLEFALLCCMSFCYVFGERKVLAEV